MEDFKSNTPSQTDPSAVRVYDAKFSQKFFFPADNEVLVEYAPIKNTDGSISPQGRFKVRAWWLKELSDKESRDPKTVVDKQYLNMIPVCSDFTKATCPNNCKWDKVCKDIPKGCEAILDPTTCLGFDSCIFSNNICTTKPEEPKCGDYTSSVSCLT